MIHNMKTVKIIFILLSFVAGLASLTSCSDDEPTPIAEAPVFAMDENYEITATCANAYKAYVNGIETILPYTITQTYNQQTIVVSGYGYGINLQNSDTVEQTFVVPALEDNHEYVDLGLPSGTLWATCNVGASSPEEYGDHFAWGETSPKDYYDSSTYKWCYYDNNGYWQLTKYDYSSFPTIEGDGKTELDPEDDAAYVNWNPYWRMPTSDQIEELVNCCSWQWTQRNGVNGQLGTGPNGNTIFLPAAGYRWCESLSNVGSVGRYWSRSLCSYDTADAYLLNFYSFNVYNCFNFNRFNGFAIRAVRVSQN